VNAYTVSSSPAGVQSVDTRAAMTNGSLDTDHGSRLDSSATQPQFDRTLSDCKLVDGTDVVLSCHVTGSPMPNVSHIDCECWFSVRWACVAGV